MFKAFEAQYLRDAASPQAASASAPEAFGLHAFFQHYSGATFDRGVYRIHSSATARLASQFIQTAFPEHAGTAVSFASDWLGSLFCLDATRIEQGAMAVLMLEPSTGKALKIPANLASFHEQGLIEYADAALATGFYERWLSLGGAVPRPDQCIGYKKPLFLGGADTVENLELSDLDVYWTISAQLIRKTKGLPVGTRIGNVSIK